MKTHLRIAAAVACAVAAFGAQAANVELYGQISTGLYYEDGRGENPSLTLNSGTDISTLWGIRGKEEIGTDGYVRFVLESGFDSTTGAVYNDTREGAFFSREALIIAGTKSVGEIAFGRVAGFLGSTGTYAQWAATGMNPMASNAADAALLGTFQGSPIMDNVDHLKRLIAHADGRIIILPGGGITWESAEDVAAALGVSEVHGTKIVNVARAGA